MALPFAASSAVSVARTQLKTWLTDLGSRPRPSRTPGWWSPSSSPTPCATPVRSPTARPSSPGHEADAGLDIAVTDGGSGTRAARRRRLVVRLAGRGLAIVEDARAGVVDRAAAGRAPPCTPSCTSEPAPTARPAQPRLAPWARSRASRHAAQPQDASPPARSGPASPARAARAGATRPATAVPPARRPDVRRPAVRGLAGECDLIAMREFVAAATAPLTLRTASPTAATVQLCSLLPMAAPALVPRGRHDLARAAGAARVRRPQPGPRRRAAQGARGRAGRGRRRPHRRPRRRAAAAGPVADVPLEVTVHDGFDYWIADVEDPDGSRGRVPGAGQQRRQPERPAGLGRGGVLDRRRHPRAPALGAAVRRGAAARRAGPAARRGQGRGWSEGSRFVGMFRAHGLLVPVWDLPSGTGAEALEEPVGRSSRPALDAALADDRAAHAATSGAARARPGQPPAHDPLSR